MTYKVSVLLNATIEQADKIDEWCYDRWGVGGEGERWTIDFIDDEKYNIEYSFEHEEDSILFTLRWT